MRTAVLKPLKIDNFPRKVFICGMLKKCFLIGFLLSLSACYNPERNCADFRTGTFEFESFFNGELQKTTFVRNDSIEIDFYKSSADTASIRWLNNCEFILTNLNPKNRAEEKPLHIKILTTKGDTYTFEYGLVGETKKERGSATKVQDKPN